MAKKLTDSKKEPTIQLIPTVYGGLQSANTSEKENTVGAHVRKPDGICTKTEW